MRFLIGIPFVLAIIGIVLNFVLAGLLALTYKTLTKETPIVTITFKAEGNNKFLATLKDNQKDKIGDYEIYGNQWQLDAGFYKMSYFANILGIESRYTLDRFQGRYKDIKDANTKQVKAYQLESNTLVDDFSFFFDTTYGSSTYKDIKINTVYTVFKTPTGLMVREKHIKPIVKKSFLDKAKAAIGF